jgi:hypothetical protein
MVIKHSNYGFNNPERQKTKIPKINRSIAVSSREPVPIKIKKKVIDRAKKNCEYPHCREKKTLEFHHKNLKNNDNRASNIELLCPYHHIKKHREKNRKTISYDIITGEKKVHFVKK